MIKSSIQVIGGADGPTAIFVTSKVNWGLLIGICAIVIIGCVLIYNYRKKRKKKNK